MKFTKSTLTSNMLTTRIHKILVFIMLTLIALPMGVLAQEETSESDLVSAEDGVVEEIVKTDTVTPPSQYYDTYKREDLPESSKEFGDFVVGPGRFNIEIAPGESKTVLLNISNRLGGARVFQLSTEDMTSQSDGSTAAVKLLGDQVGPYTIKDYINVQYDQFYVENNKRAVVPVTISIPSDAQPGGFYGSILTSVMPESSTEEGSDVKSTAPLVSRIGTLFFVTTPGEIEKEATLIDFITIPEKKFYSKGPIDMGIVYENTGSVHTSPYGDVTITNILGDTVGQVEILPWFVMPQSVRTREFSWDREFLIGRYKATVNINRGYEDVIDTQTLVFWVLPWKILVTVFTGVFLFFLFVRFLARNFEFKRK